MGKIKRMARKIRSDPLIKGVKHGPSTHISKIPTGYEVTEYRGLRKGSRVVGRRRSLRLALRLGEGHARMLSKKVGGTTELFGVKGDHWYYNNGKRI